MRNSSSPARTFIPILILVSLASLHCDRGVEPFDASEEPRLPDLAKIYPEGAKQKGPGDPMGSMSGGRGMAPPAGGQPVNAAGTDSGAAADATIRGTVSIADALYGERPANGLLFIIARTRPAGPPLAVLRVPAPSFPHSFEIGQAQVMIPGLVFEGEIQLSARLDSDGNAMTKLPGDLVGAISHSLSPGAAEAALVLDERL